MRKRGQLLHKAGSPASALAGGSGTKTRTGPCSPTSASGSRAQQPTLQSEVWHSAGQLWKSGRGRISWNFNSLDKRRTLPGELYSSGADAAAMCDAWSVVAEKKMLLDPPLEVDCRIRSPSESWDGIWACSFEFWYAGGSANTDRQDRRRRWSSSGGEKMRKRKKKQRQVILIKRTDHAAAGKGAQRMKRMRSRSGRRRRRVKGSGAPAQKRVEDAVWKVAELPPCLRVFEPGLPSTCMSC